MIGGYPNKNPTIMKKFFSLALLLAIVGISVAQEKALNPYQGYHQLTRFDSTSVKVEESGLSHIVSHRRIAMLDRMGCKSNSVIKLDYDPLSAYVEFLQVMVVRADGHTDTLFDSRRSSELNVPVYDYIAPARLIYWGASQKMIEVGHLEPNDELEYTTYKKGYSYALLADGAQGGSLTQGGLSACFDAVPHDDTRYVPPMRGHFYDIVPFWSEQPVQLKNYTVDIQTSKNLKFKVYNGALEQSQHTEGDRTVLSFTRRDIMPITPEPAMVANNDIECKLLLSTAADWQAKSMWFYGVNESYGSFTATPEVSAKVASLLTDARTEMDTIAILTHWVADNMRYAGISMGEGEGFTLHNAQMNFTDRCGVCKDKAGMLVTMLRAAGMKAYAAMTMAHERIDDIPADQFNHSVCAVQTRDGNYLMLDPTWVPNTRELWSSAEQQQNYLIGLPEGDILRETPISHPNNHYVFILNQCSIDAAGNLTGMITISAEGQSDAAVRGVMNARTADWASNLERELLAVDPRAHLIEVTHTSYDAYLDQHVQIFYKYFIPGYATVTKDALIFVPVTGSQFYRRAFGHLAFDPTPETRQYGFTDRCSRLVNITDEILLPYTYSKVSKAKSPQHEDRMDTGVRVSIIKGVRKQWKYSHTAHLDDRWLTYTQEYVLPARVYEAGDWSEFRRVVLSHKSAAYPFVLTK